VTAPRKPDAVVYGRSLEGSHWKRIGVAWNNEDRKGKEYVRVKTSWPTGSGPGEDAA
jgi:uncharacterized protein (DUF736 family)